jgi:predicted NAD-dependent protein-ADP-ribosyltransferase YbiA (DUF1768 family)
MRIGAAGCRLSKLVELLNFMIVHWNDRRMSNQPARLRLFRHRSLEISWQSKRRLNVIGALIALFQCNKADRHLLLSAMDRLEVECSIGRPP